MSKALKKYFGKIGSEDKIEFAMVDFYYRVNLSEINDSLRKGYISKAKAKKRKNKLVEECSAAVFLIPYMSGISSRAESIVSDFEKYARKSFK